MILFIFLLSLNCLTACSEENSSINLPLSQDVFSVLPKEILVIIGELAEDNNTSLLQIANCNKKLREFLFPEIIKKKIQDTCDLFLVQYDEYPDIDFSNINTQFESWFEQTQQYQKWKDIYSIVYHTPNVKREKIINNKLTVENFIKIARPKIFISDTKFLQTHFINKVPDDSEGFIIKKEDKQYMFDVFNLEQLLEDNNFNSIVRIVVHQETTFDKLFKEINKNSFKNFTPNEQKKLQQLLCSSHHELLFSENTEKLKLLLQSGVNPNIKDINGETALHRAAMNNRHALVKLLLEHGTNPNIKNNKGDTALHCAVRCKSKDIAELLLQYNANTNIQNNLGNTASHLAVWNYNYDLLKLLLEHGANPNIQNKYKEIVLHIIVMPSYVNKDVVELLLQYGADPNIKNDYLNGDTALHLAAKWANKDIVKLLLQYKADPNIKNNNGYTPLFAAVLRYTPLFDAVLKSKDDTVKLLLQYKADPNIKNNNGFSPLYLARVLNMHDMVPLLVEDSANPNIQNNVEFEYHEANPNIQSNDEIKRNKLIKKLSIIILMNTAVILMSIAAYFQFFGKITLKTVFLKLKKFLLKYPIKTMREAVSLYYY